MPPIRSTIITSIGCKPTLFPTKAGVIRFPSICCTTKNIKMISIEKNGEGIAPKNICAVAASLPRLFINAISKAGTIPTKGPIKGIRFARPAMIPMKITRVRFAPKKFNKRRPAIDIPATLAAERN